MDSQKAPTSSLLTKSIHTYSDVTSTPNSSATEASPLLGSRVVRDLRRGSAMIDASVVMNNALLTPQGGAEGHGHNIGGGTVASAMFNLSNTIIGAGIMGLPAILKALGIPLGLLSFALIGALSEYSLQRMLKCTFYAHAWSFGDLMAATYGAFGRSLLRAVIIVHNTGIIIVYLLLIGDVLSGSNSSGQHFPGLFEEWAGTATWWNSRAAVQSASCLFVIAPLVALPHIDSLQFTSGFSVLLAVIFVLFTIAASVINIVKGNINWASLRWLPPGFGSNAFDVWRLFSVFPVVAVSFTCHYNLHPILVELQPPREEKMRVALKGTFTLCTTVYCITALFGYILFGENTAADVLANFDQELNLPYSEVICDMVRFFYALHLMLVIPVIHFSLRASLDAVLFPRSKPLSQDRPRLLIITAALLATILLLSLLVPNVQFAFQFVGSAGAAAIAFTLPGMIALSDEAGALGASLKDTVLGAVLLFFGLAVTITGLTSNIHSLFIHD